MADDQQHHDDDVVHYESGIPVFNTRLNNLENEAREAKDRDDKYKQEQLKLDRRLVWFTGVLAIVGLLGIAVSGYQAHVATINADAARDNASAAKGMVEEMKKSGTDTHELATQAGKQADRTKDVADRALDQANATNELARQAKRSANANQESADTAKRAIDAQVRPWIGIASIELTEQTAFGTAEQTQLRWTFFVTIKNYGGAPARRVAIISDSMSGRNVQWKTSTACDDAKSRPNATSDTKVVFPTDILREGEFVADFFNNAGPSLVLIVCIAYQGLSGDMHHTKAVYYGKPKAPPQLIYVPGMPNLHYFYVDLRLRDVEAD